MRNLIAATVTTFLLVNCNGSISPQIDTVSSSEQVETTPSEANQVSANKARDPQRAVEEEYEKAKSQNTMEAWQLFIARHPDNRLTADARIALSKLQ